MGRHRSRPLPRDTLASRSVLRGTKSMSLNAHRLTMEEFLEQDGRTFKDICQALLR